MNRIRFALVLLLALSSAPCGGAELNIGVDILEYPQLVLVPGFPVYYAPEVGANYFFYDGDFWIFQDDNWYSSPWYDGPWERVDQEDVPDIILQIPVRYYTLPPAYFYSWWYDDPPHWGEHWGHDWERRRHDWDKRNHRFDKPAPLPDYQRKYTGSRYPAQIERQVELQNEHYRYRAHDPLVLQHQQMQPAQSEPAAQNRSHNPGMPGQVQHEAERSMTIQHGNAAIQHPPQRESAKDQSADLQPEHAQTQSHRQPARPEADRGEQQIRGSESGEARQQDRDSGREDKRGQEEERGRER